MKTLMQPTENHALERLLDPLGDSLTPAMARKLIAFRADAATQARVHQLATKCNEGELTPKERREYEDYVQAIHLVSVLQSKARAALARQRKSR